MRVAHIHASGGQKLGYSYQPPLRTHDEQQYNSCPNKAEVGMYIVNQQLVAIFWVLTSTFYPLLYKGWL
jgi:hypothetical protein